jgi:putative FmdB family regulatory protein
MPVYEYSCLDCETEFETLRPMSRADDPIACPKCGGERTRRGISVFAAHSKGNGGESRAVSGTGGGCSTCGSHSCGTCHH